MTYTTADEVYDKVGVSDPALPTATMDRILANVDIEVDRIIKTTCVPKTLTQFYDGTNLNYMTLQYIPLLGIKKLEIKDTAISLDKISYKQDGTIRLHNDAEQSIFYTDNVPGNVRIQYLRGWLEQSTTSTESTAAVSAGNSVEIAVTTGEGANFAADDWVEIIGFDGNREVQQVISQTADSITCNLYLDHESETTINKLQVPGIVSQLAAVIGAIMGALNMIGSTYTFATSYSTPDHAVTKGVPYPHFNTNMKGWVSERDFIMSQLPSWPVFA